jgi:hypothetical protein
VLAPFRPCFVVMLGVLAQHDFEMSSGEDEQAIETILSHRPHPSLGECVGARCSRQVRPETYRCAGVPLRQRKPVRVDPSETAPQRLDSR